MLKYEEFEPCVITIMLHKSMYNVGYSKNDGTKTMIRLLALLVNDKNKIIDKWVNEFNCFNCNEPTNKQVVQDGGYVPLATIKDLYDYLIRENKKNENETEI